jgi:hypothetical protein
VRAFGHDSHTGRQLTSTNPLGLQRLLNEWERYDPLELCAGFAALQLLPENGDRLLRLELATALAATIPERAGVVQPLPTEAAVWRRWLEGQTIESTAAAVAEDPFEGSFVDEVPSFDGGYLVLPGVDPARSFIHRQLTKAVFNFDPPLGHEAIQSRLAHVTASVLELSDSIVRRAGLTRGVFASHDGAPTRSVTIPDASRFEQLRSSVTFRPEDLDAGDLLKSFVTERLPAAGSPSTFAVSQVRPIIWTRDRVIVAHPTRLLHALDRAIVWEFVSNGWGGILAEQFREMIIDTLDWCLRGLSAAPLKGNRAPARLIDGVYDALYTFDSDKVMQLVVITDLLDDYTESTQDWPNIRQTRLADELLLQSQEMLFGLPRAPNEIVQLLVFQSPAREHAVWNARRGRVPPGRTIRLAMTAADLEQLAVANWGGATGALVLRRSSGEP